MKHLAVYMMLKLGGKAEPTAEEITTAMAAVGIAGDDARLATMMAELEGKDLNELLEAGTAMLAKFGGGGGGGGGGAGGDAGGAAEEEKEEEKEEEEEMDMGGGMSMFGEEEAGGGDY